MRIQRLRERVERLAANRGSKIVALVLLSAILFFALPLGIGSATLCLVILVHGVNVLSSSNAVQGEDGLFWLLMLLVLPAAFAVAIASLAVSGLSTALGWQVVRSWRSRQVPEAGSEADRRLSITSASRRV